MPKIVPHLWFSAEAKEAAAFYVSLFADSRVEQATRITDTPSGDCDLVTFTLCGREFMAISAGPLFTFNPSISLFVTFGGEEEIDHAWETLLEGGKVLMPYGSYPWSHRYGWVQDRYGLSWQLSMGADPAAEPTINPLLMFTGKVAGKSREALDTYTRIFPNSAVEMLVPYEEGEGDREEFIKHAQFSLGGEPFMAMDSSRPHDFSFNEAISFVVHCDTQEEIDSYADQLSAHPEAEQCGWLQDKYGVSWQIVPVVMKELMNSCDPHKTARVTQSFLRMKRFDIAALEQAARDE